MKSLAVAMGLACVLMAGAAQAAPSQSQLDLAKRYVAAAHMADGVTAMMKQLQPMLMSQTALQLTGDEKKMLGDAFEVAYARYLNNYMARIVPILADTYSEKELTDIVGFYESPTGQAMVAKSPVLQEKLVPVAMDLVPDLQADMRAEVCAHVACEKPEKKPIS